MHQKRSFPNDQGKIDIHPSKAFGELHFLQGGDYDGMAMWHIAGLPCVVRQMQMLD